MGVLEREELLLQQLQAAGTERAAMFAAACAERLRPVLLRLPPDAPAAVAGLALDALWKALEGSELPVPAQLLQLEEACLAAIPGEDDAPGGVLGCIVEDGVVAACYSLEAYRRDDPQRAVWSARRVHEAADTCPGSLPALAVRLHERARSEGVAFVKALLAGGSIP